MADGRNGQLQWFISAICHLPSAILLFAPLHLALNAVIPSLAAAVQALFAKAR
jgi:hypothetical protein